MWVLLLVFMGSLGIVVGAGVMGYNTVSSTWEDQRRESNEETLLDEAKEAHDEAARYGREAIAKKSPEAADLAAHYGAEALERWEEYAAAVEEDFVEEILPGQSTESIEAAMEEAQTLRASIVGGSIDGDNATPEDQQRLAMLDYEIGEHLEALVVSVRQEIVLLGEAQADSALLNFVILTAVGCVAAVGTAGLGASVVYRQLRNAHQALVRERDRSEALARHDQLTGLLNRIALVEELEPELQRARRYAHDVGVCVLDVDGFKKLNDALGHLEGDRFLKGIADALSRSVRQTDRVYRYGGDEFILMMPETGQDEASKVIKRVQGAVQKTGEALVGENVSRFAISISAGTAIFPADGSDMDALIRVADQALYAAKKAEARRKRARPRSKATTV